MKDFACAAGCGVPGSCGDDRDRDTRVRARLVIAVLKNISCCRQADSSGGQRSSSNAALASSAHSAGRLEEFIDGDESRNDTVFCIGGKARLRRMCAVPGPSSSSRARPNGSGPVDSDVRDLAQRC